MDAEGVRNATGHIWRELIHRLNCGRVDNDSGEVEAGERGQVPTPGEARIWKEVRIQIGLQRGIYFYSGIDNQIFLDAAR